MFNNREAKDILLTRLIAYVNGQLNQCVINLILPTVHALDQAIRR